MKLHFSSLESLILPIFSKKLEASHLLFSSFSLTPFNLPHPLTNAGSTPPVPTGQVRPADSLHRKMALFLFSVPQRQDKPKSPFSKNQEIKDVIPIFNVFVFCWGLGVVLVFTLYFEIITDSQEVEKWSRGPVNPSPKPLQCTVLCD